MVIVLQRVLSASVEVDGVCVARIGHGYLLLVGLAGTDTLAEVKRLATDVSKVRLMEDEQGKMGRTLQDAQGEVLAVSQFTLLASFAKGNRPSFHDAARPELAEPLFDQFVRELAVLIGQKIPTGVFGADMKVALINDGPVTVVLT
ncbi:MAG: D-tyrosyl-tRNA(Tyr) deacylase [Verrucomicrobia bacterium]|nr:D-tyrosyl-tRNA(Tyr) deacylase [Verrucomicrobiota bacterium]NBS03777.1 D-tyrosyl-tRNA(Tyr) deacylase [Verrucomicrobiota bacterium]